MWLHAMRVRHTLTHHTCCCLFYIYIGVARVNRPSSSAAKKDPLVELKDARKRRKGCNGGWRWVEEIIWWKIRRKGTLGRINCEVWFTCVFLLLLVYHLHKKQYLSSFEQMNVPAIPSGGLLSSWIHVCLVGSMGELSARYTNVEFTCEWGP